MDSTQRKELARRVLAAAADGAKKAVGTIWFLVKVILPVSLAVSLLGWFGAIDFLGKVLDPVLGVVGLPGRAAIVLFCSMFFNLYAGMGAAGAMSLNLREMTLLAVACLVAHNLVVETSLMRRTGSSRTKMIALRVVLSAAAVVALNLVLPARMADLRWAAGNAAWLGGGGARPAFAEAAASWAFGAGTFTLRIIVVVLLVMVAQRVLEEFKLLGIISKVLLPVMPFLGFPPSWSRFWVAANLQDYPQGAALFQAEIEEGKLKPQDGDLFNHHSAMSHSLFEESAVLWALGLSLFWVVVPRLVLAVALVWIERVRRHYFRRSFRAGVA